MTPNPFLTFKMKKPKFLLFLLMCVAASCSAPQYDESNLFEWSHGKVIAKPEHTSSYVNSDDRWIDSLGFKVTDFKAYPISSQNNKYHCTVRIEGLQEKVEEDRFEQITIVDSKGKELFRDYDEMFGGTFLLRGDQNRDIYFEKIDLDDNSFALFLGKWFFSCCPQEPGDMMIIVVSKNRATLVYNGPACAITPVDFKSDNFSIEFVDNAIGLYDEEEGFIFTPERLARHTVFRIYKEGNMLKFMSREPTSYNASGDILRFYRGYQTEFKKVDSLMTVYCTPELKDCLLETINTSGYDFATNGYVDIYPESFRVVKRGDKYVVSFEYKKWPVSNEPGKDSVYVKVNKDNKISQIIRPSDNYIVP